MTKSEFMGFVTGLFVLIAAFAGQIPLQSIAIGFGVLAALSFCACLAYFLSNE